MISASRVRSPEPSDVICILKLCHDVTAILMRYFAVMAEQAEEA